MTARALQEPPALPSIPKTSEPKLDVQVAEAQALPVFLALPLILKTLEPKLDVQVVEA
jgi:hypothetical protein